jgi:hypothetical protein
MKKLNIFQYAKLQARITGFAGIIAGLIYAIGGTFYDLQTIGLNKGTALAYIAVIVMPIYFAVFGFVTGIIGAFINNLFKKISK